MAISQDEKNSVTIEHIAKLTKSNDTVTITKAEGNVIIDTSVNKGSDTLKFGNEYDASKFSTKMSENGRDLELTYTDNSQIQTITIKNYFSKGGNSTKSSVKEIEINGETKNILDLYTNVVSAKGTKINGSMFNDVITGSDKADKIYTGAGNDTITANKGNDTINITGAGNKTINIANGDGNDVITGIAKADKVILNGLTAENLSYSKSGNDLVITREEEAATEGKEAVTATTTIKDYFKNSKNADKLDGVTNVSVSGKGKLVGGFTNDTITGSDKADKIYTGAGNDSITAGKGNDTINITGAGNKTINIANGDGNDVITGIAKADKIILNGLTDDKLSYSKSGNDLVITREEEAATEGKKAVTAKTTIKDFFKDSNNLDKLAGVTVKDITVTGKGKLVGGFTNDTIIGSDKADKIYTGAGNDTITANKGNDTINITGAGEKTINIANGDGNDVITGIAKADETNLVFDNDAELSYSKNGASNDLIITRKYAEQLKDKKGNLLYKDAVTGEKVTNEITTISGTEVEGTYYQNGDEIITQAEYNKIGDDAKKASGYDVAQGTYYQNGKTIITEAEYEKKATDAKDNSGYTQATETIYSKTSEEGTSYMTETQFNAIGTDAQKGYNVAEGTYYKNGSEIITDTAYNQLATDAKDNSGYTQATEAIYSKTSAEGTSYMTETQFNAIGTKAQEGYNVAEGTYYKNGSDIITDTAYDQLATDAKDKSGYTQATGTIYSKTEEGGTTSYMTQADYDKIGTDAQKGYSVATGTYYQNGSDIITDTAYDQLATDAKDKSGYTTATETIYSKTTDGVVSYKTQADYDKIGTDAQEGYNVAEGTYYKNGSDIITESAYNQLVENAKTNLGYTQISGNFYRNSEGTIITESAYNDLGDKGSYTKIENEVIYSKTEEGGTPSYISQTKYDELVSQAKSELGYTQAGETIYSKTTDGVVSYKTQADYDKLATDAKNNSGYTQASGNFYKNSDGTIITQADYDKIGTDAQNGYTKADAGDVYTDGKDHYIFKANYDQLATDAKKASGYESAAGTFYKNTDGTIITQADYDKIGTDAQKGYTRADAGDVYTNGTGSYIFKAKYDQLATDAKNNSGYTTAEGTFYQKDGQIITQADYDKIGTDAQKGYTQADAGDVYTNGTSYIFKADYDKLATDAKNNSGYKSAEGIFYKNSDGKIITEAEFNAIGTKAQEGYDPANAGDVYTDGKGSYIFKADFDKIGTDAQKGYDPVKDKVYSYGTGEDLKYSTDATKDLINSAVTEDRYNKTTVKDFFTNGEGASNVKVNGKDITDNIYNISTVKKHAEQNIVDKSGDDTYNVDNKFDFAKDKLIISDTDGNNDVLNLAQKADKLTILFDIKKETGSAVGDALYVIGKDSTDLAHGIQMEGIDKVKTADGDVTAPTNEIISDVQSWLAGANSGKGYDSVADAIQNNDADLANLIAKFAPSQPQA